MVLKMGENEDKGFIWYSLRIGCGLMCSSCIILQIEFFPPFIFLIFVLFNLFISIIHLFKYQRKAFAFLVLGSAILFILLYTGVILSLFPGRIS